MMRGFEAAKAAMAGMAALLGRVASIPMPMHLTPLGSREVGYGRSSPWWTTAKPIQEVTDRRGKKRIIWRSEPIMRGILYPYSSTRQNERNNRRYGNGIAA
jgi:hypothetical protein